MIDPQLLRDDPDRVRQALRDKGASDTSVVDRVLEVDRERRAALTALQTLQQQLNEATRQIGPLMKAGKRDEAAPLQAQANQIKTEIKDLQEAARAHEETFERLMLDLPNLPHESVPVGRTAEDNAYPFEWGEKPSFAFEARPHWEIADAHGLIDFEGGAKVTGAGFPFYLGQGARLQRALIQFFLDRAVEAGYTEVQPPLLVNEASGIGTGQLPDKEGQMYETEAINRTLFEETRLKIDLLSSQLQDKIAAHSDTRNSVHQLEFELIETIGKISRLPANDPTRISAANTSKLIWARIKDLTNEINNSEKEISDTHNDISDIFSELESIERRNDLYLIPTAEVPVTNYLRDEVLDEARLPIGYAAYTPCFRREAGSYGKDVRGLNRLHQFDKVEIVRFVHPDESYDHLEAMREHVEGLIRALGLPYRRVVLCTGDMGTTQAKTYDLEVWSAGQGRWLEVSSVSNFEAYQARRASIRFRPEGGGKPQFVHTLNGSALALPRIVATLLEHYQQADGSVAVPEVLRPYTRFDRIG